MTQRSAVQNVAGKLSLRKTQRSATAVESLLSHLHDTEAALDIMDSTKR